MSTPYTGITLHEGYNDIGTIEYNVTPVEIPTSVALIPQGIRDHSYHNLNFSIKVNSDDHVIPLPQDYMVLVRQQLSGFFGSGEYADGISYPNEQGLVQLNVPLLQAADLIYDDNNRSKIIRFKIEGPLDTRADELYLRVSDSVFPYDLYTPITDLCFLKGDSDLSALCVFDGVDKYYALSDDFMTISSYAQSVYITKEGVIKAYTSYPWTNISQLTFYKIEFPENLSSAFDGFYYDGGTAGTITSGQLGDTDGFVDYQMIMTNPDPAPFRTFLKIYAPSDLVTPVYSHTYLYMENSGMDFTILEFDYDLPTPTDTSPTIGTIETLTGITFSTEFMTFLTDRELTTIDKIRKAGPIQYIEGFTSGLITTNNLNVLQAHVNFYTINPDAVQNQRIISQSFKSLVAIAFTSRKAFIDAVVNESITLFQAAKIHDLAVQNQKLAANLMSGLVTDLKRESPSTPSVEGSTFVETALAKVLNSCGCDDYKSVISPFSYLLDLLQYGAASINYTGLPTPYTHGSNLATFINLLSDKFLQPFNSLHIDCKTLHDEFCRVRLVTELLEALVAGSGVLPPWSTALDKEREQFLQLVYQTILLQAGTSINEVRNVYLTQGADKEAAAQKLANKLGIPLYVPSTTDYTTDKIWLTLNNPITAHILTAPHLETIFGFRDTQRSVLTTPLPSDMEKWHGNYLRDFWRTQDYVFTNYSREGVIPASPGTFKSNWMPIIDPDMMGWEDMVYLGSSAAKALWNNRKVQTDAFLLDCVDNNTLSVTHCVDFNARILRVVDRNLVSQAIEDNTVYISKLVGMSVIWYDFVMVNRTLTQTNTDISLVQSATDVFDSYTETMKYNRELAVASFPTPVPGTPFTLSWTPDKVFTDATGALVKLKSSGNTTVFVSGTDFSFTIGGTKVDIAIDFVNPVTASGWLTGNITLVCEMEVDLNTTTLVSPGLLVDEMFTGSAISYIPLAPAVITNPTDSPVWVTGAVTNYTDVKNLYTAVSSGLATEAELLIVKNDLHLTVTEFNRLMVLLGNSERYLKAIYTIPRPTIEEQYEMASLFYRAGKTQLQADWVKEEIKYVEPFGIHPIKLMLNGQYFWKALNEPKYGPWDPSLQTIPATFGAIDPAINRPIVDPFFVNRNDLCAHPEAQQYIGLYDTRRIVLDLAYDDMLACITPYVFTGFNDLLNYVNTGNTTGPYVIPGYATYALLIADLISQDVFKQKNAADAIYAAFGVSAADFIQFNTIKEAYENSNAINVPAPAVLAKAVKLLLPGYARLNLYFVSGGWIDKEIDGSFSGGDGQPVYYYNVLKMKLAPGRGDAENRKEWQTTLAAWNRQPFVQPDLLPPENIVNFVAANPVCTLWSDVKSRLISDYGDIETTFNSGLYADALFNALEDHINLLVARAEDFTFIVHDYLPYFLEIKDIEARGDDIRPNLAQLGFTTEEYRYLANIYKVLQAEYASVPSSLIASEFEDVINIIIAIRSRNLPFEQVQKEFVMDILMDQDYFLIYKPALVSFPLADLPAYNKWRSPYKEMKAWKDILETRIDMEQGVIDRWQEVLKEAEDRNMPLLRDALIRAITPDCVAWQDMAEQLAKTYFIETKDNCCVKHTRVSFAIETLQGFYMALQNGIYDGMVADFTLVAPSFEKEWQWLGSYATWRAAVFVYMYPENLLYPTLKKLQSPAFITLADTVQNANRFGPQNACDAAKDYQTYLEDIKDLEICCSVNSPARVSLDDDDCCATVLVGLRDMNFYFAKGKSGTAYWSKKQVLDTSADAHGFWEELPVRKEAKLMGCFVYSKRPNNNYLFSPDTVSLYLFYTYSDKDKSKISYIKKDIYDVDSSWSDEVETDDIPTGIYGGERVTKVTVCQTMQDIDVFSFLLSSTLTSFNFFIQTVIDYDPVTDKWVVPFTFNNFYSGLIIPGLQSSTFLQQWSFPTQYPDPIAVIRHNIIGGGSFSYVTFKAYTAVFNNQLVVMGFNTYDRSNPLVIGNFNNITGVFESNAEPNTLIVFYIDASGIKLVQKLTFSISFYTPTGLLLSYTYVDMDMTTVTKFNIEKVYPVFALKPMSVQNRQLAFAANSSTLFFGAGIYADITTSSNYLDLFDAFALTPEKYINTAIQSSECITDMAHRALDIKNELRINMSTSQGGTSVSYIQRTSAVREVLYEAYYFVPMLLALDQQKRGEFPTALNWYRSVYDFTQAALSSRKIFYGLTLEESIVNTYTYTPHWLLDPLNPHLVAQSRTCAYTKYTVINIVQCLFAYADREFTTDTIETVPLARRLYTEALELLKIPDLQLKPNRCELVSEACMDAQVELKTLPEWSNLYADLKTKLRKLGNADLIESIEEDIVDLLNSGTEETYAEKFADAFDMIDGVRPEPGTPNTVLQEFDVSIKFSNASYSYLYAINDHKNFNEAVIRNFTELVTVISGISEETLHSDENSGRIAWLSEEIPANNVPYEFGFMNESGVQHLDGSNRYDPFAPTRQAYDANVVYSNAGSVSYRDGRDPKEHIPLLRFHICLPKNPVYQSLTLKGNVELYKIQNCRNIAGMVRELDAYAAATDSVTGMPFIGASGNLVTPGIGNFTPSQYRFRTLMERAKQIVAQAQQMESLFLAALEKKDAESYSQLRARQDLQTAKSTVKLQNLRITQATDEKGSAMIQLDKATFTEDHFNDLLSGGYNAFEIASLALLASAAITQATASVIAYSASASLKDFGTSGTLNLASSLASLSSLSSQIASYQRRSEEWNFQKGLAGFDIKLANQQIKISEDNIRIVTQERDIAQMNTDHAQDSLEFLKTKFTNAELYNYMSNVLERSYSYMLNLATSTARVAERQLYFERQEQAGPFILDDYWESPTSGSAGGSTDRRGLTGSARLTVDITRLDEYAFETNKRKLQMTKVISLAQNFPSEFQQFKETGVINFALTNKMFDYDFPGHYLRLINSVKTTVVGLLPVYDSIKASLTSAAVSYTVIGGTIFQRTPIRRSAIDSVALTSANNATGVFEMQPMQNNELLNPFEGMGIESQWEFKMPRFSNRMDYTNIADVLLTVEYTAIDSFQYRTQVLNDLDNSLSFNRGFSFKNNFPDQWYDLAQAEQGPPTFDVVVELKREMFPQGIVDLKLNAATGVALYFARADGFTQEIEVADFNLASATVPAPLETVDGLVRAPAIVSSNPTPVMKLKLSFDNTAANRQLFNEGNITDILLLVGCKAELNSYPL